MKVKVSGLDEWLVSLAGIAVVSFIFTICCT